MKRKIRIAIIEDSEIYRGLLVALFKDQPLIEIVFVCKNGLELIDSLSIEKPDLVLLDLEMPIMNGKETTEHLHKYFPEIKILILTGKNDEKLYNELINKGAHGFLTKDKPLYNVLNAIITICISDYYFKDLNMQRVINNNPTVEHSLSDNEKIIIKYLCRGLSSKKVAEEMSLSKKTIDHYRERIYKKTETSHIAELAIFAYQNRLL